MITAIKIWIRFRRIPWAIKEILQCKESWVREAIEKSIFDEEFKIQLLR
jgi:hypothetical protein